VFGNIPHRTMAARIEDGIEVFLFYAIEAQRLVELSFGIGVLLEATGDVSLKAGVLALGIERRSAALWWNEGHLGAGILEHVVWRSQLLQPEASLAARIAELVVRGQNHQDFHTGTFAWSRNPSPRPDLEPAF